jgi:hypothetical protein
MGVISPDPTGVTHVYEWLIQITEDQDEEGNFYPSAATLTLVYDYTAWESLGGRIHMPLGPFYSQPWDVQLPYGPEYPVSKPVDSNSFSWPVHVYYDGDTVKRVMALYNHNIPPEERIPPDPKGATDADVWKADGFDTYPFVGSFPKSGTGTFSLGSTKTYYPKLTFEGDGMPEDAGNGYNYSDGGTDTFTLEQFGDADGRLVAMGYNGKAVICGGGPIFKAVRTRTQLNTGEAQSHYQAVWIPWGDRDAILSCEYHVHIGSTYTATRSVRHSHMFCSGIEVVPGNPGDGRPCCPQQNDGYIIQKIGGISAVFNGLPAPVDAANTYATNWKQPTAICPVPDGSYPSSYLCTESDFLGLLPNASSYDEFLGTTQEAETTFSYAVRLARSGAGVEELDAGDTQLPMVDWLLGIRNEQDFYNPLRMLRTYSGQGVAMAFPSTLYIKPIGGIYSIYLDFIKDHGMLSLWVGEPH